MSKRDKNKKIYSLISLDDFKALMGIDDRDNEIAWFSLLTATCSIEHYCKRNLVKKAIFETIEYSGDLYFPLREYPVKEGFAAYLLRNEGYGKSSGEFIEPGLYQVIPDCGTYIDIPFAVLFNPAIARFNQLRSIKFVYRAGYAINNIPSDLSSACLELAAWNFNRYKNKNFGITNNVRGKGRDGVQFESEMPENVKALLEPYRRKTI